MNGARRLCRRVLTLLLALMTAVPALQVAHVSPVDAYTHTYASTYLNAPNLYYDRNSPSTLNGTLSMYYNSVHYGGLIGGRYRITSRGGSGDGTSDDCITNHGPAPDGVYGRGDGDSRSRLQFMYKHTSRNIVLGYVWFMDRKLCNGAGSTERSELFIHSQGFSDWTDLNYESAGCIKVNQTDRGFMASIYLTAYDNSNGRLSVYG